jgi:hypothetical protein
VTVCADIRTKPSAPRPAVSAASTAVAPTAVPAPITSRNDPTTTLTTRPVDHDVPGGRGPFVGSPTGAGTDRASRTGGTASVDTSDPPMSSRNGGYASVISAE